MSILKRMKSKGFRPFFSNRTDDSIDRLSKGITRRARNDFATLII